jgi:hypothetical protein
LRKNLFGSPSLEKISLGGNVTKVEAVTRGKTVSYDAAISRAGKKSEFSVMAERLTDESPISTRYETFTADSWFTETVRVRGAS